MPSISLVITAYSQLSGLPTLGSAAALAADNTANNVVKLDGSGNLPALNGAALTSLSATNISAGVLGATHGGAGAISGLLKANGSGTVSAATSGTDYAVATNGTTGQILVSNGSGAFGTALTVGTSNNNIVQLDGSGHLPAVNGSALTSLNATNVSSGTLAFARGGVGAITADSDGSTITFDISANAVHTVTLGGNRTLAVSNATTGSRFMLRLTQDGSGSRTVTWFNTIIWAGGSPPTLSTAPSAVDLIGFLCTGTNTYDGFVCGQGIA